MDAALQIFGRQMMISNDNMAGEMNHTDYLNDCKGVVYSYLSKQLSSEVQIKHSGCYLPAKSTKFVL